MFIKEEIRKCVVFICIIERKGEKIFNIPRATGFLVSVPFEGNKESSFLYLVTAKHCVEGLAGKDATIRLNSKEGKAVNLSVPHNAEWQFHPSDDMADVAVIGFGVNKDFDIKTVPVEMFVTDELIDKGDISIGNDVFIVGLFSQHSGAEKNLPIVRTGTIAMLPDEKIFTKDGKRDAYLIEARSIGGISGSPVFFFESVVKDGSYKFGSPAFRLGGLIHGHWDIPAEKIDATEGSDAKNSINMGIAIVIPAKKIYETLYQKSLSTLRNKQQEEYNSKKNESLESR